MTFIKSKSVTKTFKYLGVKRKGEQYTSWEIHGDNFNEESTLEDLVTAHNAAHSKLLANLGQPDRKWSDGEACLFMRKALEEGGQLVFRTETRTWRVSASLECCGERLSLGRFTNTCGSCGADYDGNGNRLAPRSQWGEETGETWNDCYGEW